MITDLATAVTTVSPEELDKLFASVPDSQLVETKSNVKVDTSKEQKNILPIKDGFDVPFVDDLTNLEEKKEEVKEENKEEIKEEKKEEGQEGKDEKKDEKKEVKEEKETPEDTEQVKELLKNSVEYLIE